MVTTMTTSNQEFKVRITRVHSQVTMQVLSIPESWRGKNTLFSVSSSESRSVFWLKSFNFPQLSREGEIFISGNERHRDGEVAYLTLDNDYDAALYYSQLKKLLIKAKHELLRSVY
jgi:hypothetical protein